MKESKKLMLKFLAISLAVILFIGSLFSIFWGSLMIGLSFLLWIIISTITVIKAWTQVPHKWVYVIEKFGEYYMMMGSGLRFVFPWLSFYEVKHKIFTGTMKMALFDDEIEDSDDYQGGIVDFNDESAKIKAFLFFHVSRYKITAKDKKENPGKEIEEILKEGQNQIYKKAAYETSDPIAYIKAVAEAALRSFLAQYDLFDANELKSSFNLIEIANMMEKDEVKERKKEKKKSGSWKKTEFGKKLLDWGFTPIGFEITEFQYAERTIEERARVMKAKKDKIIAEYKKNEEIILSEGEADSLRNLSEARAEEVNDMVKKTGASREEVFLFIVNRQKYDALTKAGNVTWIGGADSDEVKKGVYFGAGFKK